jgi:hypothetical protein
MSPAPAAIFTPDILYLYLTLKSLKHPNPLTTITAHQPQHHHHQSLYIVTFLTSSTLNMSNETFKSGHAYVPKLTDDNHPVWKQKIKRVLIAKKAYNVNNRVEPLPPGNSVTLHALQEGWHDIANQAIALIHIRGCDQLLPLIDHIDDPREMWEAPRD